MHSFSDRVGLALQRTAGRLGWHVERYPGAETLPGHLKRLFALYEVDCVLDVGANRGQFASTLRRSGYGGRIISFEPVPEAFDELLAYAESDERWQVRRLALGDRAGTFPLNVTASTSVSSFLVPTAQYAAGYVGGRIQRIEEVEVARLDAIFDELCTGSGVFLKTDTQGYDLRVVEGAAGCLDRIVGVQIEMSVIPIYEGATGYVDALRFMQQHGFTATGIFPIVRDDRLRVYEFDGIFVRASQDRGGRTAETPRQEDEAFPTVDGVEGV